MRKKAVQQGRSERRGESYSVPYAEPLSDARTPLADFFRILLEQYWNDSPMVGPHRTGTFSSHSDQLLSVEKWARGWLTNRADRRSTDHRRIEVRAIFRLHL
jgi:hypothetical protein